MIKTIGTFLLYIVTRLCDYPVIKRVIKKSIMGNYFDKTIEYYTGRLSPSGLDDHHSIEYVYKNKSYIVVCENEDSYREALIYISKSNFKDYKDREFTAFEDQGGLYKNITSLVRSYQGPNGDFYDGTGFPVKKHYITDNKLYIVDEEFNFYIFDDDEDHVTLHYSNSKNIPSLFNLI